MDGFFDTMDAPKIILILVTIYFTFDLMVLGVNYVKSEGNTNYKWLKGPFLINNIVHEEKTPPSETTGKDLGQYTEYAGSKGFLNEVDVRRIIRDYDKNEAITGYTALQLLAYAIVPLITFLSIAWWGISTRASKAEWTFWILFATVIVTSVRTAVSTATGTQIIPESKPPLEELAGKLGITAGDEFKYNFIARKGDGGAECMVEGEWPITDKSMPTFRGGSGWAECSMENLLM